MTPEPKDLPIMKWQLELADKLLELGQQTLAKNLPAKDYHNLMLVTFCLRQLEHLKSLCALYRAGCGQDAGMICRSMIEGYLYLLWAAINKDVAIRWWAFGFVTSYRTYIEKMKEGIPVSDVDKAYVKKGLEVHGDKFLKKNKRGTAKIDYVEDPFSYYWHVDADGGKVTIERLVLELIPVLNSPLVDMSDWIHWSIRGFEPIFQPKGDNVSYDFNEPNSLAYSFVSGLLTFIQSFVLLDDKFDLGIGPALKALQDEYEENQKKERYTPPV